MSSLLSEIGTYPKPATPHPLYANGAPERVRQFLYEQDTTAAAAASMRIPLGALRMPELRGVLQAAVDRINSLHASLAPHAAAQDVVPSARAAAAAITALYELSPSIPAQIFPLSDGGLQIEWHHGSLEIEIECSADESYYVFMAHGETTEIDEEASGWRASQLFGKVRQALTEATGQRGGQHLVFGRPF